MSKLQEIYNGYKNLIFNNEEELANYRASICNKCSINDNGICSTKKCIENKGCGCGCSLKAKQRSPSSKCPIGEW